MMKDWHMLPAEIEAQSMKIIEEELGEISLPPLHKEIIKRVIHTSADFEYARTLRFSPQAVQAGLEALQQQAVIVTDTNMGLMGINADGLRRLGCTKQCFMADPEVKAQATANGTTRAVAAMDKAAALQGPLIFAIGNAPTALLRIQELIRQKKCRPALIIGVPVGFVNVIDAKEGLMKMPVPYIVAKGRKGGSTIAAAICNALLYMAIRKK